MCLCVLSCSWLFVLFLVVLYLFSLFLVFLIVLLVLDLRVIGCSFVLCVLDCSYCSRLRSLCLLIVLDCSLDVLDSCSCSWLCSWCYWLCSVCSSCACVRGCNCNVAARLLIVTYIVSVIGTALVFIWDVVAYCWLMLFILSMLAPSFSSAHYHWCQFLLVVGTSFSFPSVESFTPTRCIIASLLRTCSHDSLITLFTHHALTHF